MSAAIQIPALPMPGNVVDLGSHVIITKQDNDRATARSIELLDLANRRGAEVTELRSKLEALKTEYGQLVVAHQDGVDAEVSRLQAHVEQLKQEGVSIKQLEHRLQKAETQARLETERADKKAERIQKQQKEIKLLQGEIKTLKKQLDDARKRQKRDYVDESKPTIRVADSRIIVQLHNHQIHVHDPASCYLISSQPINEEPDYAPVFRGYPFEAMLDQHADIKDKVEGAINSLAMGYRKAINKVLVADLRKVSPAALRKIWEAGIIFAADLHKPEVMQQIKTLPGIGPKTLKQLEQALIAASVKKEAS